MSVINSFFTGFKSGQKEFGDTIGAIVNTVLLSIVYFIGVGIVSIFAKIVGKSFLETKIDPKSKTYWTGLNLKKKKKEEYFRQF